MASKTFCDGCGKLVDASTSTQVIFEVPVAYRQLGSATPGKLDLCDKDLKSVVEFVRAIPKTEGAPE